MRSLTKKLWVDTNVIIRMVTGEPSELSNEVFGLMKKVEQNEYVLRISPMVIAECCWVLESYYEFPPEQIASVLEILIESDGIEAEEKLVMKQALLDYGKKQVDFIDAYLASHAKSNPPEDIVTWDKHFRRLDIRHNRPGNW